MSTASITHSAGRTVRNVVHGVRVTVPAGPSMKKKVLADAVRAYGLDLSDDDRADKVRARRSR